jgi:NAD(P)-dependent dehydrogenase (short-subunit alcohol dehydrogenase family)
MNRLDGKIALISGAARGIGAEAARLMIEAGAKVAIGDVLDERGRETLRALESANGEALYTHLDVTREEDWTAAVSAVTGRFGRLDILVNNAGVFLGTKLALPALRDSAQQSSHGSAIVNLSSVAGLVGSSNDPLYSMTKGGVSLFTKSAALEFARKGYRIRVNSIHPGTTETEMGDQVLAIRARNLGANDLEPARRQALTRIPIGRMGIATDIAKGIVFLASDDAGYMTGSGLVVDGGITAQ